MKKMISLGGVLLVLVLPSKGQFIKDVGVYGSPTLRGTMVFGELGLMAGARGMVVFNHKYAVGAAGYGLLSENIRPITPDDDDVFLKMRYGGAVLEYISQPDDSFHLSTAVLLGVGDLAYTESDGSGDYLTDAFYMVEPEMSVVLVLSSVMQVGAEVGYRMTMGTDLPLRADAEINNAYFGVLVRVGTF